MSTCLSCGEDLEPSARFCPNCGLPTSSDDGQRLSLETSTDDDTGPVGLLRPQPQSERSSERPGSMRTIIAVLGALGAVAIAWLIFRSPGPRAEEVLEGEDPASAAMDEDAGAEAPEGADRAVAEVEADASESDPPVRVEVVRGSSSVGPGEPLLIGQQVGYRLVALVRDRLIEIDLDSGELRQSEVVGTPVGVVGDEVIVFDSARGFVAVSLDDPATEQRVVFSVPEIEAEESRVSVASLRSAVIREPDTLLADFGGAADGLDEPSFVFEINLSDGSFGATEIDIGGAGPPWLGFSRFGLVWVPGGGLFEAIDGTYRRLADGFPLLMGLNYVIVSDCPEPEACGLFWVERGRGRRVDRNLPDLGDVFWIREIDDGARILWIDGDQQQGYFDVERGRWLPRSDGRESEGSGGDFLGGGPEALSLDGRWLAMPTGSDVLLVDLATEAQYRIDPEASLRGGRFFLVPSGQ